MSIDEPRFMTGLAGNGHSHRVAIAAATTVPFLDLASLHAPLREQLAAAWRDTLADSSFVGGRSVAEFEAAWAAFCGTRSCVGVANGTDAIELVLAGLGIGPGDEVIVPANTFVATAEAVVNVGATPVFVDVDPDSLLVTAEGIEAAITPRTRSVIVVHLYGYAAAIDEICAMAAAESIHVIEDAAQAHGAALDGRPLGSFGTAGTFSFYPGKNLGALGDAGAVVTDDLDLAETIRTLADHGRGAHLVHDLRGRNSRLDGLQAAALNVKLPHLPVWNARRRTIHAVYRQQFRGSAVRMLAATERTDPAHHLEVVRVPDRDRLRHRLRAVGVETGIHYAMPCHKQPAFAQFDTGPLPVAEDAARHQLSIPIHPTMSPAQIEAVIHHVRGLL